MIYCETVGVAENAFTELCGVQEGCEVERRYGCTLAQSFPFTAHPEFKNIYITFQTLPGKHRQRLVDWNDAPNTQTTRSRPGYLEN